jgi:hypothetical protein
MASRSRIRRLISTFPLAPMNHPHHQPYRSSSLLRMRLGCDSRAAYPANIVPNHQNFHTFPSCCSHFTPPLSTMVVLIPAMDWQLTQQLHQHPLVLTASEVGWLLRLLCSISPRISRSGNRQLFHLSGALSVPDFNSNVGKEELLLLRSSFVYRQSQTSHEVSFLLDYSRQKVFIALVIKSSHQKASNFFQ